MLGSLRIYSKCWSDRRLKFRSYTSTGTSTTSRIGVNLTATTLGHRKPLIFGFWNVDAPRQWYQLSVLIWKSVSIMILTTFVHCYKSTKVTDTEKTNAFYSQLRAVPKGNIRLPKGNIMTVMGDLNSKVCSFNTLLGDVMRRFGLREHSNMFAEFRNFQCLLIRSTISRSDVDLGFAFWLCITREMLTSGSKGPIIWCLLNLFCVSLLHRTSGNLLAKQQKLLTSRLTILMANFRYEFFYIDSIITVIDCHPVPVRQSHLNIGPWLRFC